MFRAFPAKVKPFAAPLKKTTPSFIPSRHYNYGTSTERKFLKVDNPYNGSVVTEVPLLNTQEAVRKVEKSTSVFYDWRKSPLEDRIKLCQDFMKEFEKGKDEVAKTITASMGKPLNQSYNEINGMYTRINKMIELAPEALAEDPLPEKPGFFRKITKEPVGVVLVLSPWNYPLLTAINTIVPAILAGNAVVIKHSPRTPTIAESFEKAFEAAGAPSGLVTSLICEHDVVHDIIQNENINFVAFTGSVEGGRKVYKTVAKRFIDCTLELGGKDAAYIASDADFDAAVEAIVDGAMYNAGQSCCAIERVYVHQSLYKAFIDKTIPLLKSYKMGDPFVEGVNLGPLALPHSADFIQYQVKSAVKKGAKLLLGGKPAKDKEGKGRFFEPTLISEAGNEMDIMSEETFGPVIACAKVSSDEEAIKKINECKYGLTAAVFTKDQNRADAIARDIRVGTVFMNRCDFLDPELPWSGYKNSGKGVTLSKYGFRGLTKLKGWHFKL